MSQLSQPYSAAGDASLYLLFYFATRLHTSTSSFCYKHTRKSPTFCFPYINLSSSAFHDPRPGTQQTFIYMLCIPHNMQPTHSSRTWTGALQLVPLIVATILLFSIITLGLSTAYGKQMAHAPLNPYQTEHPSAYPYAHRWSNM